MNYALLLCGSPFTVGEAEPLHKMTANPEAVHKMATIAETYHKIKSSHS